MSRRPNMIWETYELREGLMAPKMEVLY